MSLFGDKDRERELAALRAECERLRAEAVCLRGLAGVSAPEPLPGADPGTLPGHAYLHLDEQGTILRASGMMAFWLGRPREGLKGRSLSDVDAEAPWGAGLLARLLDFARVSGGAPMDRSVRVGDAARELRLLAHRHEAGFSIQILDRTAERRLEDILVRLLGPVLAAQVIRAADGQDQSQDGSGLLAPRRVELSILFADLRGFTRACAELPPERVKDMLDGFLADAVRAVAAAGGHLDKFLGDGCMALFGAPDALADHRLAALDAAAAILRGHRARMQAWTGQGLRPIDVGVGLASGEVVAGFLGPDRALAYTALGDAVNVASRLCAAAGGGEILMTRPFYDRVSEAWVQRPGTVGGILPRGTVTLELKNHESVEAVRAGLRG